MKQVDVLIVEDDVSLCEALCHTLELAGYRAISADNGQQALNKLRQYQVKLVVSDVQLSNMDGIALLENIKLQFPDLPVLLMTAYGTIPKAVKAIQAGADEYLVKPFEAESLIAHVAGYLLPKSSSTSEPVMEDVNIKRLFGLAAKVAKSDVTVLMQGESGTGKEIIARYIHQQSPRRTNSFIAINCAAIPDNMLEAVLFGHEKGAFTGAFQASPGKFEQAQGGTLLLDEISEMDLGLQAKLLRVLQEKEVERLGGRKTIDLDVRVLATTNRNLKQQVANGDFREDLYYRLNVFPLKVPPLRERLQDIIPLAKELLQRHWKGGKALPEFDRETIACLLAYRWPGNVRELKNVIQRAVILQSGNTISADNLAFEDEFPDFSKAATCHQSGDENRLDDGLRSMEEKMILETLKQEGGSRKSTAERLGISSRTLRYKIARMRDAGVAVPC